MVLYRSPSVGHYAHNVLFVLSCYLYISQSVILIQAAGPISRHTHYTYRLLYLVMRIHIRCMKLPILCPLGSLNTPCPCIPACALILSPFIAILVMLSSIYGYEYQ